MKVALLRLDGLDVAILAAQVCVSEDMPTEPRPEGLTKALQAHHDSLLENIVVSFAIGGISRVTETQLVRHRMASYAVQSGRYCDRDPSDLNSIVMPRHHLSPAEVRSFQDELRVLDERMRTRGTPAEYTRYFYPQGLKTNVIMTCNFREFSHMCGLRRCKRAQREIRELFDEMANAVKVKLFVDLADHPDLYSELRRRMKPQCSRLGYCPETSSCGGMPSLKDLQDAYDEKMGVL